MGASVTRTNNVARLLLTSTLSLALVAAASAQTPGQPTPSRAEVWDLKLGTPAALMPSGLREVYFRYDDELEYWAKANDLPTEIERYSGTKVYDIPVVLSALFDDAGTLAGLRIVSDPRDTTRSRDEAYALRNFLTARFGRDGWNCTDLPPTEGEEPVGRTFIKQDCNKTLDEPSLAVMQTRYLRKKGQHQFDPRSNKETEGQFDSTVHFELSLVK